MNSKSEASAAGQAVNSKRILSIYDLWVLGISNSLIWKCRTKAILNWMNESLTSNHLDVGVGTGYYLDHCSFPNASVRLGLLDLNPNSLAAAASRASRYAPETYQADILQPLPDQPHRFDSVSLNYLLHCLPGDLNSKSTLFDHLNQWLNPGAIISGSTILAEGVPRSLSACKLMNFYNEKKIFTNSADSLEELQYQLQSRYTDVELKVTGCVALFRTRYIPSTTN
ncbi:class I SAM-dependent methyltransferase [Gimesia sp.]|uniref:class I SAM-dependent methyltransferase n=1 Tax=Gimesia sp. TaxID=2024833 RepID=UPI000C590F8A|nr:class I SAM-dependent methyltransferase [Gimesia sp.]MAX35721.1 methyltransferase type 12 [Gimesia sp.]HAH45370.1 methyltransferase type 12 [Planctomycetaceae bacterium]HBL47676.1 methyltransferase type 12 [Planctomycetaceae bacterium]|tara:strand:- start:12449 stop:13126 length:678 start_codon:yes stop_codon:yes gene_type:complete